MSPPLYDCFCRFCLPLCPCVRHKVCKRNSSETTERNLTKLCMTLYHPGVPRSTKENLWEWVVGIGERVIDIGEWVIVRLREFCIATMFFFQNSKLSFMLTSATIDRNLCNTGDKNKNLKIIDFVTSFSIYNGIKDSKHN